MGGLSGPIGSAEIEERAVAGDPGLTYFRYVPPGTGAGAPLFVTVHGRSRTARRHAELFAPLAARAGVVLVAPLFTLEVFPDYHCLGRAGRGARADHALERILAEVAAEVGARADAIHLFGYSGGGQFAHRYMMAYPQRIAAVALGAAGWYTFPDPARPYPLGIAPVAGLPGVAMDPQRFLQIPCLVLVGADDILRDPHLNQDPEVDAQQGQHRLERAQRWVAAMQAAGQDHGSAAQYRLEILAGVGHSFADCMTMAGMGEFVFDHLFGHHRVQV